MKKILVVMSTLYNGGAERSLVNFLNELPQDKYEIVIVRAKTGSQLNKGVEQACAYLGLPSLETRMTSST